MDFPFTRWVGEKGQNKLGNVPSSVPGHREAPDFKQRFQTVDVFRTKLLETLYTLTVKYC